MNPTTDDFRILPLKRDRDALILIALGVIVAALVVVGLAFLPDAAWERLEERSKLLWGALVAIAPIVMVAWQRLSLRKAAIKAMGTAASAPITINEASELALMEHVSAPDPTNTTED